MMVVMTVMFSDLWRNGKAKKRLKMRNAKV